MVLNNGITYASDVELLTAVLGIRQSRTRCPQPQTNVVEFGTLRIQTGDKIAQTLAPGELGVGQADEMAPCCEVPRPVIRVIFVDEVLEVRERHKVD